ncbi:hypothetical protein KVR01_003177 [Diaporthe batatas]|uniref:uncharacterized protein n=1 Tax=Diaporthe batatas TaxID=748121 RepID=UPI001D04694E|nr:uncharacterized protein KVR01_003177 [Diaporthe batatas]KAG8167488.1 hypothetical protein KVR01_003177 [Diaporthe batatas]
MPPAQVKSEQEDNGQESPGVPAIQPNPGGTTSQDSGTSPGFGFPNVLNTHPLPVIHETEESKFNFQSPGLQGTTLGTQPYSFSDLGNHDSNTLSNPFDDPFVSDWMYSARPSNMNAMSRNMLPSARITRSQGLGGSGTGARRPSQPQGQTGIATNQAVTRAAPDGMAGIQGQASNQGQFPTVDLTGMDYAIGSPNSMGLYGGTMNSILNPNAFMSSGYDPFSTTGGDAQQTPQGQGTTDMSQIPKFDPELLSASPDFMSPVQYDSFGEDEQETKPDPRRLQAAEGTPTRAPRARRAPRTPMAPANMSPAPATPNVNSPGGSAVGAPSSGGGASASASGNNSTARPSRPAHQAHVPPNRIAEAGPVPHPDPEFRPYGTNHWHVFLTEPTLLKYLSSTEIKDIREHCFGMAGRATAASGGGGGGGEGGDDQPLLVHVPVAEGSAYTTADAQAVWKHCDAYIRRRGQVRNNQAARRSRMRKDAETRYWKALALQFGAPDHDFDWGLVDEEGNLPANIRAPSVSGPTRAGGGTSAEGGGGPATQTRARARVQMALAQQQQLGGGDGGLGQGQQGGGGSGQGGQQQQQAANRRASSSSVVAASPGFDFNQPLGFDEDDKANVGNFDPFTGEF